MICGAAETMLKPLLHPFGRPAATAAAGRGSRGSAPFTGDRAGNRLGRRYIRSPARIGAVMVLPGGASGHCQSGS